MYMNKLRPGPGARQSRKRIARGQSSDHGKTAGRGHAGQKSRSGGYKKVNFEGGQMPIQRRVPKRGFKAARATPTEIRLEQLNRFSGDIGLEELKNAGLMARGAASAKVIGSGELNSKVNLRGVAATGGARRAIEELGGEVSD
ncbi:50S ribosomal protein L15 [Salinisphaera sp. USBA-960]|uniref:50S ribosomal protein L15 n=1 Tax=Salinisphaera orenii TaxID=856731 RepID=UPI000DBE0F10|nr:50S ribosomal protein L15 [Salifodinibacter halophilus]NNC26673.1 50S ribosomal protein L15 [Salifodinibacter halophilus]